MKYESSFKSEADGLEISVMALIPDKKPYRMKAEIILMFYTFSMSSVIMDHHHISKLCQILHKRNISLFMLTHSMNQLYNCTIRFLIRYQCHDRNLKPVCFLFKRTLILHRSTPSFCIFAYYSLFYPLRCYCSLRSQ